MRVLVVYAHPLDTSYQAVRFTYLAHYDMNRSTSASRARFVARVEAAMRRF